ncbi:Uma2 family endonuclease [Microcoleus sp. FACHB-1515]|uniref:Uma2 family endonuclease n=1 Tax=Cyanophyceae TaxID=3028117 RepID=UPI001682B90B|nr:Uma2 family endonuclease [Microcoleus sp. FACHB-1515]MBD2088449.1 Uma2 family endonuclease [Microcoleus sp. FACHB-1515]
MGKKPIPGEQRVILPDVSWQQFEMLLQELGDDRTSYLTFDRKRLELMTPTAEHQRCNQLIESLILLLADELNVSVSAEGAVLLKRADLLCATEPDSSYYLDRPAPLDRRVVDLMRDLPPDLVVEVAITKSAINKLAIYAALEISEVWRYVTQAGEEALLKGTLTFYQLQGDRYVETPNSQAFPMLTTDRVVQFLEHSDAIGLPQALRTLRAWVQEA